METDFCVPDRNGNPASVRQLTDGEELQWTAGENAHIFMNPSEHKKSPKLIAPDS